MRNHHPTCSHSSLIKLTSKVSICKDCSVLSFSSSKNECLLFTKPPIFNKKYDFYFDGIICETHGLQHYEHGFQCNGARTLEEEQLNDTYKEKVAKENGI